MTHGNGWTGQRTGEEAKEHLYMLNCLYVDALALAGAARGGFIGEALARLPIAQRRLLATCPFTLFDARFGEGAFWNDLAASVQDAPHPPLLRYTVSPMAEVALFYAWHLVRADRFAARLQLGMADQTQSVFARLTLPRLHQLATDRPDLVSPRWHYRESIWHLLIGGAMCGPESMDCARLFGIQLIAGDLAGFTEG